MEHWKPIDGYPGYEVSDLGSVRTHWKKVKNRGMHGGTHREYTKETRIVPMSDDGNGYLKVLIRNESQKACKKVHRLVAEAFIAHDPADDTVDHIKSGKEGKLDNSVNNLRWVSRRKNIQKAYADGVCNDRIERQKKPVVVEDTFTGEEIYFDSVSKASDFIGVDYTTISHTLKNDNLVKRRYQVFPAGREDILLYGNRDY